MLLATIAASVAMHPTADGVWESDCCAYRVNRGRNTGLYFATFVAWNGQQATLATERDFSKAVAACTRHRDARLA